MKAMNTNDLMKFFKLEDYPELFEKATKPKSCGGGKDFKKLALDGDNVLNRAIMEIYSEIKDVEQHTRLRTEFHSRRSLVQIGRELGIDRAISTHNLNHMASDNEIKEAIESLLGASHQVNGFEIAKEIVKNLLELAKRYAFFDANYRGELNELFQKTNEVLPSFECLRIGGKDHRPIWQCIINGEFQGTKYIVKSSPYSIKKDAEQDAALKFLKKLGRTAQSIFYGSYQGEEEITQEPTQSIIENEIIFSKTSDAFNGGKITITKDKDNSLQEWMIRESEKNPYNFLLQVSALSGVCGSEWSAIINQGVIILLHLKINEQDYFEVGYGPSKTKARIIAAKKIINQNNLFELLNRKEL